MATVTSLQIARQGHQVAVRQPDVLDEVLHLLNNDRRVTRKGRSGAEEARRRSGA